MKTNFRSVDRSTGCKPAPAGVGLGAELGKRGAESIIGTGNPSSHSTPQMQNYTQPSDNTRVAKPIYPLPEFK